MYIILIFFMQLQKVEFRKNYLNTISDQLFHPLDEVLIVFDRAYTSLMNLIKKNRIKVQMIQIGLKNF